MFDAASSQAQAITNLFNLAMGIGALILLLVTALTLYASFRFRAHPGDGEPTQIFGNRKLEIGWTAAPAILLACLAALTLYTMSISDPAVAADATPDVVITGHQWWWEVRYPQRDVVTANEIHIPAGKKVLVRLESGDVIHSFWVPQLGRKMDMIPGHPNSLWLQADAPGVYMGACSEYCGTQHAWMRIRVIAQPPAEFEAWLQQQSQPVAPPAGSLAAQGQQIYEQKTCSVCHEHNIGPDLNHLASRDTLAAGVLQNTSENLAKWLANPQAIKPGSHMPSFNLTDQEVQAMVAYLEATQ